MRCLLLAAAFTISAASLTFAQPIQVDLGGGDRRELPTTGLDSEPATNSGKDRLLANEAKILPHRTRGTDEADEYWSVLGHRLKITDWLLVLSTLAIAVFTFFLWKSTEKLWRSSERQTKAAQAAAEAAKESSELAERQFLLAGKQVDLAEKQFEVARQQFLATHRPEIIVRTVERIKDAEQGRLIGRVTYVNAGTTYAKICSLKGLIVVPEDGLGPGLTLRCFPTPARELAGGEIANLTIDSIARQDVTVKLLQTRPTIEGHGFYCIGTITYADGQNRVRETGFCWWFDHRTGQWTRKAHPVYEYAY